MFQSSWRIGQKTYQMRVSLVLCSVQYLPSIDQLRSTSYREKWQQLVESQFSLKMETFLLKVGRARRRERERSLSLWVLKWKPLIASSMSTFNLPLYWACKESEASSREWGVERLRVLDILTSWILCSDMRSFTDTSAAYLQCQLDECRLRKRKERNLRSRHSSRKDYRSNHHVRKLRDSESKKCERLQSQATEDSNMQRETEYRSKKKVHKRKRVCQTLVKFVGR